MTYDMADGYVLLFGGCLGASSGCASLSNQTWAYQGGVWTNLSEARPHPSARWGAGMVYDSADGYVLLFGGQGNAITPLNDTWKFSAGRWTNITTTAGHAPSVRRGETLINDTADGYVVMCCGIDTSGNLGDTWKFVGGTWSALTSTLPVRNGAPGTMDGSSRYGVLFGGGDFGALGDVWTFSGGSWSAITSGPPAGQGATLSFDPAYGYDLLFGGVNGVPSGQTWALSSGTWTQLAPTASPSARCCAGQVFDARDGYVLLYGGGTGGGPPYDNDTWIWGASNPLALNSLTATPNPVEHGFPTTLSVSASGGTPTYSYAYAGLPPGCATSNTASLPCTPTLTGNYPVAVWVNDSAGHSVQGTLLLSVVNGPSVTSFVASPPVTDVSVGSALSVTVAGGAPPLTYTYTGLPAGCSNVDKPTLTCVPSAPGTSTVVVNVTDSVGKYSTGSLSLTVHPRPNVPSFSVWADPQDRGLAVTFSTSVAGGTPPYHYGYTGLPGGCSSASVAPLSCTPTLPGNFSVEVNATDAVGASAFGFLNLTVTADPVVSSLQAAPSTVDAGTPTVLTAAVQGGVAPLTYAYGGLPGGCSSRNSSTLSCTPSVAGTATVDVNVTDIRGYLATSTVMLTVNPALRISQFRAVRLPLDLGDPLGLQLSLAGGTVPYSYSYSGLPTGCASTNASSWSCTPTQAGSYSLVATVTDRGGGLATTDLNLTISPPLKITSFGSSPSTLTLGGTTDIVLVAQGGAGPLAITYLGLPPGCLTANATQLSCTPSDGGAYTVEVVAVDSAGSSASANTTLTVNPPSPLNSNLLGLPVWAWALLVAIVVVLALVALIARRRRGGKPSNPSPSPPAYGTMEGGTYVTDEAPSPDGPPQPGMGEWAPSPAGPEIGPGPPPWTPPSP